MTDMEKVIEGVKHCKFGSWEPCYENDCPYYQSNDCTDELKDDILSLLKEQPEQKHGHWIEQDDYNDTYYKCSVCGEPWVLIDGTPLENGMHFCPKCGARMESEVKQDE